jgi:uncharacterized protein (DUF58 family)
MAAGGRLGPLPSEGGHADEVLRRLELTVTRKLDGMLQGDYRGLVPGRGTEPGETRLYEPGDDTRRIDWNVTARMQTPHLRENIADRELECRILVDLSPNMFFGTAQYEKRDLALAAAAAVGFLAARGGNRIGALLATPAGIEVVPAKAGRNHLRSILHRIATARAADGSGRADLAAAIGRIVAPNHRKGLAVCISDFTSPGPWARAMATTAVQHDLLAVEVVDPRELELPDVGVLEVVDAVSGQTQQIQTSNARLRKRYASEAALQRQQIADSLRAAGADHLQLRTDQDWLSDVVSFVALRRERQAGLRAGR